MTLGRRIAQRRRMLGLSQETLGEKMGVSRQAISKWESGAANPEMEKLVAMSKLFDVSVGWMLGVEDEQKKEIATEEEAELIGQLLRTIRTPEVADPVPIAEQERDMEADPVPGPKRIDRRWVLGAGVAVVCLVLCCVCLYALWASHRSLARGVEDLERRLAAAEGSLDDMDGQNTALLGQVRELSVGMAQLLEEMAQLDEGVGQENDYAVYESLTKWSLIGEASEDLTKVTLRFSGVTAVEVSGVRFIAQHGGALRDYVTCTMDGRSCYGQLELPVADDHQYLLMIDHTDGTTERIVLEGHGLSDLRAAASPQVRTVRSQDSIFDNHSDQRFWMGWEGVFLSIPELAPKDAEYLWEDLMVSYHHNGKCIQSVPLEDQQALEGIDLTQTSLFFQIPTSTYVMESFEEGDLLELRLEGVLRVNGQPVGFSVGLICWEVDDEDLVEVMEE
ncbi:MAG: helix-turn-helix domain-containing protein [Oscillospiraceae bacterium]|nr:helix-turn-helix domain-containing protein [Oscillospiraceae bacterium]